MHGAYNANTRIPVLSKTPLQEDVIVSGGTPLQSKRHMVSFTLRLFYLRFSRPLSISWRSSFGFPRREVDVLPHIADGCNAASTFRVTECCAAESWRFSPPEVGGSTFLRNVENTSIIRHRSPLKKVINPGHSLNKHLAGLHVEGKWHATATDENWITVVQLVTSYGTDRAISSSIAYIYILYIYIHTIYIYIHTHTRVYTREWCGFIS